MCGFRNGINGIEPFIGTKKNRYYMLDRINEINQNKKKQEKIVFYYHKKHYTLAFEDLSFISFKYQMFITKLINEKFFCLSFIGLLILVVTYRYFLGDLDRA
jgi:hypothetical protein